MNKKEMVRALMDAVQRGDLERAKMMFADDFQFSGSVPEPMDADDWLDMSTSLKTAFPDLNYHFKVFDADGDVVRSTWRLSGTHTGSLDMTNMEMGVIPATNRFFASRLEKTEVTVKGNKITSWVIKPTEGAGLKGILRQLRVKPVPSV
jgi:predicted ester cyclase